MKSYLKILFILSFVLLTTKFVLAETNIKPIPPLPPFPPFHHNLQNLQTNKPLIREHFRGTITAVSEGSITVEFKKGDNVLNKEIKLDKTTQFLKSKMHFMHPMNLNTNIKSPLNIPIFNHAEDLASLKVGDVISVSGTANNDGTVLATRVHQMPAFPPHRS